MIASIAFTACKKEPKLGILNSGNFGDNSTALKDAADFPIGVAISATPFTTEQGYSDIVKRDFDGVTFEYLMKHGAIVQGNGNLNFTNTDALVNAVGAQDIFGHTLAWHQNQNATYVKNFAGITIAAAAELLVNPGFEGGDASSFTTWAVYNTGNPAGSASVTVGSGSNEVRTGSRAMKVVNPTAYPGNQWRVQVASDLINTVVGQQYTFTYWVKAANAGGSIRLSTGTSGGGSAQYQGDQSIGTSWQSVTWTITANSPQTRILFDLGQAANTYYIDDASFKEVVVAPSGAQVAARVEQALGNFITGVVNKYKAKVKAWDVVNELFTDNGEIRNNTNSPAPQVNGLPASDWFVWSEYLGRDMALKAFNLAKAADPNADLYINDYSLESNTRKLDSLIKFVAELKTKGAKVDGIGTQMHISWNTNRNGIDQMFQKMAATGLKVRVSELDVRTVLSSAAAAPTPELLGYQAAMYKYVVQSYLKHVPAAQRAGITVWGVNDKNSWLYNSGREFPLLYNDSYAKKPAYAAFLQGLKGQ